MSPRLIDCVLVTMRETEKRTDLSQDAKEAYGLAYMKGIVEGAKHVATIMQPEHAAFQQPNIKRTHADILRIGELITACETESSHA